MPSQDGLHTALSHPGLWLWQTLLINPSVPFCSGLCGAAGPFSPQSSRQPLLVDRTWHRVLQMMPRRLLHVEGALEGWVAVGVGLVQVPWLNTARAGLAPLPVPSGVH